MKKFIFRKINQNGVAIIWTLMFSMIFLVIVTTLVLLVVKGLRLTSTVDQSNRAYLAAEAGMERAMYEIKQQLKNDIFWCPAGVINYNRNLDGASLRYRATVTCTPSPIKKITIESTGTDRDVVNRKLKSEINFVDPTGKIEKFDTPPPGWSNGYYDFPSSGIASSPLIIQQFDITRMMNLNTGETFMIGLGNGTPGSNYFYFKLTRNNATTFNASIEGPGFISYQDFTFSMPSSGPTVTEVPYRVTIEYARQGTFYTIVRATVLKRDIAGGQETFTCKDASKSYVLYAVKNGAGFIPTKVIVKGSATSGHSVVDGNGFIILNNQRLRVDNMVLWGKE